MSKVSLKIKEYWPVAALMVLAVIIEIFREITGIPVTILDLLFSPFLLIAICYIPYYRYTQKKKKSKRRDNFEYYEPLTAIKTSGYITVFVLMAALGIWGLWEGLHNPLKLYTGVRGAAHGYTLALVGIFLIGTGFWCIKKTVPRYRKNQ